MISYTDNCWDSLPLSCHMNKWRYFPFLNVVTTVSYLSPSYFLFNSFLMCHFSCFFLFWFESENLNFFGRNLEFFRLFIVTCGKCLMSNITFVRIFFYFVRKIVILRWYGQGHPGLFSKFPQKYSIISNRAFWTPLKIVWTSTSTLNLVNLT